MMARLSRMMFANLFWLLVLVTLTWSLNTPHNPTRCNFQDNGGLNCTGLFLSRIPVPRRVQEMNAPILTLDTNAIRVLRRGSFRGYDRLRTLKLSRNQIARIHPRAFLGLANLRTLYMDNNSLTAIPAGSFRGLGNLTMLDLSRNRLRFVQSALFKGLRNLMTLLLRHNQIKYVQPGSFDSLGRLRVLNLHHNRLKRIRYIFNGGLTSVRILALSSNRIERIPLDAFRGLDALRRLYLAGNAMTTVDMAHWPDDITYVDLSKNCQLEFITHVQSSLINLSVNCVENMQCSCRNERALRLAMGDINLQERCDGILDRCARPVHRLPDDIFSGRELGPT